jgi:hypothetical protein
MRGKAFVPSAWTHPRKSMGAALATAARCRGLLAAAEGDLERARRAAAHHWAFPLSGIKVHGFTGFRARGRLLPSTRATPGGGMKGILLFLLVVASFTASAASAAASSEPVRLTFDKSAVAPGIWQGTARWS